MRDLLPVGAAADGAALDNTAVHTWWNNRDLLSGSSRRSRASRASAKIGDFGRVLEAELVDRIVGRAYSPRSMARSREREESLPEQRIVVFRPRD